MKKFIYVSWNEGEKTYRSLFPQQNDKKSLEECISVLAGLIDRALTKIETIDLLNLVKDEEEAKP